MKDAKGHGSDSRTTFGKRTQIPYPAHQSGIAKLGGLAKTFLKSESGGGQIHGGAAHYLGTEFATKMHDPEATARLAPELHEQMREAESRISAHLSTWRTSWGPWRRWLSSALSCTG